jgi:xylulokinase
MSRPGEVAARGTEPDREAEPEGGDAQGAEAESLVIGFDLGSSAAKVVLATRSGTVVARGSSSQGVERRTPELAEQDATGWWATFCRLTREALGSVGRVRSIDAVAISGHFPTLLIADEDGHPLAPAMLYADIRAEAQVRRASDLVGQALHGDEVTPKLLWLRRESPLEFARVRRVFGPQDYLAFRLTGSHALDHHTASRLGGLLDVDRLEWRTDVIERLGLSPSTLPRLQRSGTVVGTVMAEASVESGIPAGTPVITGVGDTLAELLGAGVVRDRQVLLYYGTTATVDVCTHDIEAYLADPSSLASGAPYREVAYALVGPALPWVASGFDATGPGQSLDSLDDAAARLATRVDAPFVLPFFIERPPSDALVNRPAIVGFDLGHGRPHLHRALLESFGYAARMGLERAGFEASGMSGFVAAGGGATSEPWRQIVSDVLGVGQSWDRDADGALGAAMLAAWSSGIHDTFGAGLARWHRPRGITHPDPEATSVHEIRYRIWRRLAAAVAEAYRSPAAEA